MSAARERGLPACVIRPGVIFGPGVQPTCPAGSFALFGRWIVAGDGSRALPLVYVEDVVDALLLGAARPGSDGAVVNLVDPAIVTQRQFIEFIQTAHPEIKVAYIPVSILMLAATGVELLCRVFGRTAPLSRYRIRSLAPLSGFDQATARGLLGWNPRVGVSEGLRETFAQSPSPGIALSAQ